MSTHPSLDRTDELSSTPLSGLIRVLDMSTGIAGAYCTKLLVDGGAEVIKIEPPDGDPLRRRRLLGGPTPDGLTDSGLFTFLHSSKRSVSIDPDSPSDVELLRALIAGSHAVVWSPDSAVAALSEFSPHGLRSMAPHASIVTISPFGLIGEPARPCNEFTLQAMGGGACGRGTADREPLPVGGSFGDFIAGVFASVGLLTAQHRSRETGVGELVDVSMLDCLHLTQTMFAATFFRSSGRPYRAFRVRTIPLVHPTSDGYVGFQITTGQQWQDFSMLIGREDWAADPTLTRFDVRIARFDEVNAAVDEWTSVRTTDEIVEAGALLRLPVAPVANGATLPTLEPVVDRDWYLTNPTGGFLQPAPHYIFHGSATSRPLGPSPSLGEHTEELRRSPGEPVTLEPTGASRPLPFAGLRIADFTAFWAGPIIGHYFAMLGADVIHIESTKRPDGIRAATLKSDMSEGWWEASPTFAGTNTNKRDLAIDLGTERGRELAKRLVAECDIVLENYSTRVMENWGFDYDSLRAVRPDLIMVRAPGFGSTGPWRDRVAYATTIEQACGAAWVTGFADDRPDIAGGALDPVAGTHAVFAILLALEHRCRTGEGQLVEVPQFTSGINVFAEPVIEHSLTGRLLGRVGSRSWTVAPQGSYRVRDVERDIATVPPDEWVAISVDNDEQWRALRQLIGESGLINNPSLDTVEGRYDAHDAIDAVISSWTRTRTSGEVIGALIAAGIPAALFVQSHQLDDLAEVKVRGLYEQVDNPVLGTIPIIGYPVRFEAGPERLHRRHAPLLGEHNRDILESLLGLTSDDVDALEAEDIIGTRPGAASAW